MLLFAELLNASLYPFPRLGAITPPACIFIFVLRVGRSYPQCRAHEDFNRGEAAYEDSNHGEAAYFPLGT